MAQQEYLDIKSFAPSELAAKQGSTVVVFHPGVYELEIGKGSASTPFRIPHCIAYHQTAKLTGPNQQRQKAAICNRLQIERVDSAFSQVVHALKLRGLIENRHPKERPSCSNLPASADSFKWLPVANRSVDKSAQPSFVAGEDVLHLWHEDPYEVTWPMVDALDCAAAGTSPPQKVQDGLEKLWRWALENKLKLGSAALTSMSAVLVVAETLHSSVVVMLADVLLRGLGFESLVVHLESCAAAFGQGVSSACVVNVGPCTSSVCCVEDGMILPHTVEVLPYGLQHAAEALLRLMQLHNLWPDEAFEPDRRVVDLASMQQLFMEHCFMPLEGDAAFIEQQVREAEPAELMFRQPGRPVRRCEVALSGLACVAPMALFVPGLLQELGLMQHARGAVVPGAISAAPNGPAAGASMGALQQGPAFGVVGLDAAVVRSVRGCGDRVDQRQRLFSSMVLVGAAAPLRGLRDMLERRVLHALPQDEVVEMVAVLEPREGAGNAIWRGGVLLALLDSRENWLSRTAWLAGGVNPHQPSKLGRADNLHARLFWYSRAQHGV